MHNSVGIPPTPPFGPTLLCCSDSYRSWHCFPLRKESKATAEERAETEFVQVWVVPLLQNIFIGLSGSKPVQLFLVSSANHMDQGIIWACLQSQQLVATVLPYSHRCSHYSNICRVCLKGSCVTVVSATVFDRLSPVFCSDSMWHSWTAEWLCPSISKRKAAIILLWCSLYSQSQDLILLWVLELLFSSLYLHTYCFLKFVNIFIYQ